MDTEILTLPNLVLFGEACRMLAEGKDVIIPTKGNSMLPFIHGEDDTVTLRRMDRMEVGHIVLVCIEGRYILHRIWAIDGDRLDLMGDGNLRGHEKCLAAEVMGTAISINRPDGRKVDPLSPSHLRRAGIWRRLLPLRRIILGIYRRLP